MRVALERSALVTPRIQVTLQRIQLQDQKVARVSAQLDTLRREIASLGMPSQRAIQQLPIIEQQISAETDGARRKQLEQERAQLRLTLRHIQG